MSERPLRAAVVMASAGRPELLGEVIGDLDRQTVPFASRVVTVPDATSVPAGLSGDWTVVTGTRGLAAQRNAGIDALDDDVDVVFFFDDDAVVRDDYLEQALAWFEQHPNALGLTGRVLLDGATTDEIPRSTADDAIARSAGEPRTAHWAPSRTLYGCNFAYRRSAVPELRFDSRLPLYSWLEDHDFARRLMRHGTLAKVDDCVIVHRGASSGGRTNHLRLGYSQFMNPVHLRRVGSFPVWLTAWEIFRPTAKNVLRSVAGSERTWRRERLRGNLMAVGDVLRGRITPERIASL